MAGKPPEYRVRLARVGTNASMCAVSTCIMIDGTWYAAGLDGDSPKEWEGAGYRHPTLQQKPQSLEHAFAQFGAPRSFQGSTVTIKSPAWEIFAFKEIDGFREKNNNTPILSLDLEFIARGTDENGEYLISSQRGKCPRYSTARRFNR